VGVEAGLASGGAQRTLGCGVSREEGVAHASPRELKTGRETIKIEPVCDATVVGNFHRLYERTVFFLFRLPFEVLYKSNRFES
jgi:hypothetical protein